MKIKGPQIKKSLQKMKKLCMKKNLKKGFVKKAFIFCCLFFIIFELKLRKGKENGYAEKENITVSQRNAPLS